MDALIQDLLYSFSHEQDDLAVQCEPQEGLRSVRFRLSLPLSTWMIFSQSAQNKVLNAHGVDAAMSLPVTDRNHRSLEPSIFHSAKIFRKHKCANISLRLTMPTTRPKPIRAFEKPIGTEYRGKQTRTGNSLGFRFDSALFKSHPEFAGEVKAQVIAPGRMLVSVAKPVAKGADPVMASFLAFLASDIAKAPETIMPMRDDLAKRIDSLIEGVTVSRDQPLGEESLL
jgi:prlF antitoxin for toxin YhaV_toxin